MTAVTFLLSGDVGKLRINNNEEIYGICPFSEHDSMKFYKIVLLHAF